MKTKKKKEDLDDLDNIEGLEGFEDELDFGDDLNLDGEMGSGRNVADPGVAKQLAIATGKGFAETLIKETAKKTLPESYEHAYSDLAEVAGHGVNILSESKGKIEKSLYDMGKEVSKLLPFKIKMLDDYLEDKSSEFERAREASEEEQRTESINASLNSIFDRQLQVQTAIEARRESEEASDRHRGIRTTAMNLAILNSIDSNVANQTAFTTQVTKEYYRKSLELQYRQYFVQLDTLKSIKEYFKGFSVQFDNIVKNTGLPEAVKIHTSEAILEGMKQKAAFNIYDNYIERSSFVQGIKDRASRFVTDKTEAITERMDEITSGLSMVNEGKELGGNNFLIDATGSLLGGVLGESASGKLSAILKAKLGGNKELDNYIKTLGTNLEALNNSPETVAAILAEKARRKAEESLEDPGMMSTIKQIFYENSADLLTPEYRSTVGKKQGEGILTSDSPAIFDNRVHRSITEVIPMYLSRILKENTDLRSMYGTVNSDKLSGFKPSETLHYNYAARTLSTADTIKSDYQKELFKDKEERVKASTQTSIQRVSAQTARELSKTKADKKQNAKDIAALTDEKATKKLSDIVSRHKAKDSNITLEQIISKPEMIDERELYHFDELGNKLTDKDGNHIETNLGRLVRTLKTKAKNIEAVDETINDTYRNIPIKATKDMFVTVSKASGRTDKPNIPDNRQLEIISRAVFRHMKDRGPITPDAIVKGDFLKNLTKKEYEQVADTVNLLRSDLKKVFTSTSEESDINKSRVYVSTGALNNSLAGTKVVNTTTLSRLVQSNAEVFGVNSSNQTFSDEVIEDGRITGTVFSARRDTQPLEDIPTIRSMDSVFVSETQRRVNDTQTNHYFDKLSRAKTAATETISNLKQTYEERGLEGVASSITQAASSTYKVFKNKVSEARKELAQRYREVETTILTSTVPELAVKSYKGFLTSSLNSIDKTVRELEVKRDSDIEAINTAIALLRDKTTDQEEVDELRNKLNDINNSTSETITSLNNVKTIIITQSRNMDELLREGLTITDIRTKISTSVSTITSNIDQVRHGKQGRVNV